MPIEYQYEGGWPSNLKHKFHKRVSALVRGCNHWKIGITNNPKNRFSLPDYRDNYDRMIVMYRTESLNSARELETHLIEHYRGYSDNINTGGGGPSGEPPYFLYVVKKIKRKRGRVH